MPSARPLTAFCPTPFTTTTTFRHAFVKSVSHNPPRLVSQRNHRRSPSFIAQLHPPNEQADWVYVDVIINGLPNQPADLQTHIADDAKSLVRVALRDAPVELSVVLCGDHHIRRMNSKWRGIHETTDVLSFPQHDPDRVVLGDIVISVETAARQAAERGHQARDEIRVLLVHGLLHLLGYDHEGQIEGDWLTMAQMENRLLNQLQWVGEGLVSAAQAQVYRDIVQP